jgi:hypothetical protein
MQDLFVIRKDIVFTIIASIIMTMCFVCMAIMNTLQTVKNYNVEVHPKAVLENIKNTNYIHKDVYVYMSVDYPVLPEYGKYSIAIMENYCRKHGYIFKVYNHNIQNKLSPYWIRVQDMYNILQNTRLDSIIVYFDLDAIVHPKYFSTRLETVLSSLDNVTNHNWDMYVSIDPHPNNREMNTGIIIARNTEWTRAFVRLWLSNYPKGFWKKDAVTLKWECNNCLWAGDEYEQGMFNRLYQRDIMDSKNRILPVGTSILGNNIPSRESFTLHLMGYNDKKRLEYFKNLYEKSSIE